MAKSSARYTSHTADVTMRMITATQRALWLAGHVVVDRATPDVPLDTGTLRRSAVVSTQLPDMQTVFNAVSAGSFGLKMYDKPPGKSITSGKSIGFISTGLVDMYVSYNTPYAARLHEGIPPWTPRAWKILPGSRKIAEKPAVGQPKWLEMAINAIRGDFKRMIAIQLKAAGF